VRTYTVPGLEILNLAEEAGLKLLMGVWWDDPRYLEPTDRGSWQTMASEAWAAVKEAVESYAGHAAVLGFVLGNDNPRSGGPLARATAHRRPAAESLRTGSDAAPEALFSYANSPPPSIWIPATSLASTSSSRTNLPTGAIWRSYRSRSETDPFS
jgi:hypothetical protein